MHKPASAVPGSAKPGRNDPCPCGSGKKYKQCCMAREAQAAPVSAAPSLPPIAALLQDAVAHHQAGRLADAEALYRQILAREPEHADALHLLGVIAYQARRHDMAAQLIERSIALNPTQHEYHANLGSVRQDQGLLDAAAAHYRASLRLKPDSAEAHNNLGNTLQKLRRYEEAIVCYLDALRLKPGYSQAHHNLGCAYGALGRFDEAIAEQRQALALQPNDVDAHNDLGIALQEQGRLDEAIEHYRRAIALKPDYVQAHSNLGKDLSAQGRFGEAIACFRRALEIKPDFFVAHNNLLCHLNYDRDPDPLQYLAEARRFGERIARHVRPYTHSAIPDLADPARRPLRIGLVSGDLRNHPVGFFLESVVAQLDRSRFCLVAYDTWGVGDALSARLKTHFAEWRVLVDPDDALAAQKIHADRIDILVDLAGHTADNRLPVFAYKPAPVQAAWLGYFASTGVKEIDYIVADPQVLPAAEASHFVERPWRLPDCYLCFTPPHEEIEVGPLPMMQNGYVTFGCFNKLSKLNERVVALWSRVLQAVPGSKLVLKAKELTDLSAQEAARARFVAQGIAGDRIETQGYSTRERYLAAYREIDIGLDPFPYPGGTTTVEALWMGVPVLSLRGERFLSHAGESLLGTAGLGEWIAASEDEYVAKAQAMTADIGALAGLRARLRVQLLKSPLCDAPRFAANLGRAFEGMWSAYCARGPHA